MKRDFLRSPQFWIGVVGTVGSIIAITLFIDPAEVVTALRTARPIYLVAATGCVLLFLVMRAFRWRLLLQNQIGWGPIFHIQNIGYMLTMLLPLRIGDIARAVLVGNIKPVTFWQGTTTMIVERLFDLLFFVVLFPFAIAQIESLPDSLRATAQISGFIAIGGLLILLILATQREPVESILDRLTFLNPLRPMMGRIFDGFTALSSWRDSAGLLIWTVIVWLPIYFAYDLALRSVGLELPGSHVAFVLCCAAFGVAVPSSPGQLGVFHAAVFFALTSVLQHAEGAALSFAILLHAAQYLTFVVMGIIGIQATGQTFQAVVDKGWAFLNRQSS